MILNTIEKYLHNLSSKSPSPGGGVAGALSLSQAIALTQMVYTISQKKISPTLDNYLRESKELIIQESTIFEVYLKDKSSLEAKKRLITPSITLFHLCKKLFQFQQTELPTITNHLNNDLIASYTLMISALIITITNMNSNLKMIAPINDGESYQQELSNSKELLQSINKMLHPDSV